MITVKPARVSDIHIIRKLAHCIWPGTYKEILSADQMDYMLELIYSSSSIKKQIKELKHKFIIVYEDDVPIGFASYSLKPNSKNIFRLHKIYVLQGQQGKGIGKLIIGNVINDVKPEGAKFIELNVNRNNPALQFYKKNGFKIIAEEDIDIDNGYFMNDFVMQKKV